MGVELNPSPAAFGEQNALAPGAHVAPDQRFFDDLNGELTDKGYINQALARERRPVELERLFAESPDEEILVL